MNEFYIKYHGNTTLSRCEALGQYIIDNNATVRSTAKVFGISKSTVHKDITKVLKHTNRNLYNQVAMVLQTNKQERHIRGGIATRDKYQSIRQLNSTKKSP
ncbi:MAG: stage III sporulation protein D [Ruminococcaceae bacterium]|nr:stage III sporulation protein D [Oscillospiraceae bacterium]